MPNRTTIGKQAVSKRSLVELFQ